MKSLSPLAIVLLLILPAHNVALWLAHTCDPDAPPLAFILKILLPGLIALDVYLFFCREKFVAALAALLPLECACAWSAWHSIGEVASAFLYFVVTLNLFAAGLYAFKYKRGAVICTVILALWIVPCALSFGRW